MQRKTTVKSVVVPLLDAFVEYLLVDGVALPAGCSGVSTTAGSGSNDGSYDDNGSAEPAADAVSEIRSAQGTRYAFPQLKEAATAAMGFLRGRVLPKLKYSTPQDAAWMDRGSL